LTFQLYISKLFAMDKIQQANLAIKAALRGDWPDATKLNIQILKENSVDCEALNRLAQCYKNVGNFKKAISMYQKVLKINKYNVIAQRNLVMLKNNGQKPSQPVSTQYANTDIFLEEAGKTKLVCLVNIAPATKILSVSPREKLELTVKRKAVFVVDQNQNYIGALPDDLSYRLMRFMKSGYKYDCFAKTIERNIFIVLIREKTRSKRLNNQPTFPIGANEHDFLAINAPDVSVLANEIAEKSDSYSPKELSGEQESQTSQDDEED